MRALFLTAFANLCITCGPPVAPPVWQPLLNDMPGALLSVWGTSEHDVFVVGADSRDGRGPLALHYDGQQWTRMNTGLGSGNLWWVNGVGDDTVFMTGTEGTILRYTPSTGRFVRTPTPSSSVGSTTIFGLWGATTNDVWAAGRINATDSGAVTGVVWHFDGTSWQNVPLPADADPSADLFKVWGSSASDVWVVGANATTLHYDGSGWATVPIGDSLGGRLITVHGHGTRRFAVGGTGSAVLLEGVGNSWRRIDARSFPAMNGLYVPAQGGPVAVGIAGTVFHQDREQQWHMVSPGPRTDWDFHSLWIAPSGEVWAVGGNLTVAPLSNGMLWRFGARLPEAPIVPDPSFEHCSDEPGTVCTWAGTGVAGFNGDQHSRVSSTLYQPVDLEFAPTAPYQPFIVDWQNHRIRAVDADGTLRTVLGTELPGDGDPMLADHNRPGPLGSTISLNHPTDLLFDPEGQLLVAVWHNHKIRRIDLATGNAYITIGRQSGYAGDGLDVNDAANGDRVLLAKPSHLVWGPNGELFVLDQDNFRIRRVDPSTGTITSCAGTGTQGMPGDGAESYAGPASGARFYWQGGESPEPNGGLAMSGNELFISDTMVNRIRVMDIVTGEIRTYAGTGTAGHGGDGGPALQAEFNHPNDLEIGPEGDLYVTDTYNSCIRAIDHTTLAVRTVAGTCGTSGYGGDGGPASQATLYFPWGIAFDHDGNLYVADTRNNRIRRVHR